MPHEMHQGCGGRRVRVRSWCRADFAGGTLDIWPLGLLHEGACTVNVALDLAVEVTLESRSSGYRVRQGDSVVEAETLAELFATSDSALIALAARYADLPPADVTVVSGSPRGGGLGASSALVVGLLSAAETLVGQAPSSFAEKGAVARDIEAQLMSLPTGRQDHYPALLGGALKIDHVVGGDTVTRLDVDLELLRDSMIVAYSGQSHFSAGSNWQIVRRRLDGDAGSIEKFAGIAEAASVLSQALEAGNLPRVGELMSREWGFRGSLAPGISTERIELLLETARRNGAWGGKACGAGGGGCLFILLPPERRSTVEHALTEAGAELLAAGPQARSQLIETLEVESSQ